MDTNSGLFTYFAQRLDHLSVPLLILGVILMAATFAAVVIAADMLAVSAEPILAAPLRWSGR
jgi:hypothetical protein